MIDTWDGIQINFIDLDNLRKNKRAAGRPKDLADLDALGPPAPRRRKSPRSGRRRR